MHNFSDFSDEMLMAFADGQLGSAESAKVASRLETDVSLRNRLQPFVLTRQELPALLALPLSAPIPERLLNTVREAPMGKNPRKSAESSQSGLMAQAKQAFAGLFAPQGFGLAHAFTFAALLAAGAGAGFVAGKTTLTAPSLTASSGNANIAMNGGVMFAGGDLARVLETSPSLKAGASAAHGSMAPLLTFASNDGRFCRQYEIAGDAGGRFGGFACRNAEGRWQVVFHSALAGKPAAGKPGYETAAGPGDPALEAAIDRYGDGSRLGQDEEARLLARGWQNELSK